MTQSHINHAIRVDLFQKNCIISNVFVAASIQRVITFIKVLMLMTINQNKKSFLCERMHGNIFILRKIMKRKNGRYINFFIFLIATNFSFLD